jgi:hypothetical protein
MKVFEKCGVFPLQRLRHFAVLLGVALFACSSSHSQDTSIGSKSDKGIGGPHSRCEYDFEESR